MLARNFVLTLLSLFLVSFLALGAATPSPFGTPTPFVPSASSLSEAEGFPIYLPLVMGIGNAPPPPTATPPPPPPPPAGSSEWTQHAHDAQRTSYTAYLPPTPWRWKWAWNGPNASGGVKNGKFRLPRNSQPVAGGGRVYIAAGTRGVFALSQTDGSELWNRNPGGASINSTPAYHPQSDSLFVLSTNGTLYKLNAATGNILAQFASGASSSLPLPPALEGDRVWFSMGSKVFALNRDTLEEIWRYEAGSPVHTPPAYSPSYDRVVVATQDLYVHAIDNSNGSRVWRVKQTPLQPGDPGQAGDTNYAEVKNGWPVIAEGHGLVFIKLRLDWQSMWSPWSPWPSSNAVMRQGLLAEPENQALLVLRLSDGTKPFVANVGHGGFGDGGYMPMGPMPVVKRFSDGTEVAYVVMRGYPCLVTGSACDGRGDSRFGEMLLDDNTVSGYQAGYVRFINNTFFPTDEQAFITMAGDGLFGGHWMFGLAHRIVDRSPSRGSGTNPIRTENLPHIMNSEELCGFSPSHYCPDGLSGNGRVTPPGFYIYYNRDSVYDQYWSEYADWVISGNMIYFVSTDGAIVALEPGNPQSSSLTASMPALTDGEAVTDVGSESASSSEVVTIPYTAARDYAGRTVRVEGTLRWVFNNGKAVYLAFKNPHQGALVVRILKQYWTNFPQPPETMYQVGMVVRVSGLVGWYQGDPQILVYNPSQIEVLGWETSSP